MQFSIQQPFFTSMLPLNPLHFPMNSTISTRVRRDLQFSVSIPQKSCEHPQEELEDPEALPIDSCEGFGYSDVRIALMRNLAKTTKPNGPSLYRYVLIISPSFYVLKTSSDSRIIHPHSSALDKFNY